MRVVGGRQGDKGSLLIIVIIAMIIIVNNRNKKNSSSSSNSSNFGPLRVPLNSSSGNKAAVLRSPSNGTNSRKSTSILLLTHEGIKSRAGMLGGLWSNILDYMFTN